MSEQQFNEVQLQSRGSGAPCCRWSSHRIKCFQNWLPFVGAVGLPHVGGIIGAYFTEKESKTWYENLDKPSWRPPSWVFGPVSSTLYTSMGYASYLVWRDGGGFSGEAKPALILYGTHLLLNWSWTPLFFKAHKFDWAAVDVSLLWGTVAGCTYLFWCHNKTAGWLMIPYLGWTTLVTALTFTVWNNNKKKKSN